VATKWQRFCKFRCQTGQSPVSLGLQV
jgi:hypothetical protein